MIGDDAAMILEKFLTSLQEVYDETSLLRMFMDSGSYEITALANPEYRELRMFIILADRYGEDL